MAWNEIVLFPASGFFGWFAAACDGLRWFAERRKRTYAAWWFSLNRRRMHMRLYEDPVYGLKAVDSHLPGLEIRRDLIAYLYVPELRRIGEPEFEGLPCCSILRRDDAGLHINGGDTTARGAGADFRGDGDRY